MTNFEIEHSEVSEPESLTEERISLQIDDLLDQLPSELQDIWFEKISAYPLLEQLLILQDVIDKRSQAKEYMSGNLDLLLPEGVEIFQGFPEDVKNRIELLRGSKNKIEVGYGQAGHVISSPSQTDVCYKLLFDEEKLPLGTNDISKETSLQSKIFKIMDGKCGVRVPTVYGFIHEKDTRAMIMELLNAPSLRKVVERHAESMPDNFDYDIFFSSLEAFIEEMHTHNIYHRDLHAGNVLVDRKTGLPCVIDFGLSTDAGHDEETAYMVSCVVSGQVIENVLKSDIANLETLKNQVKEYYKKGSV